MKKSIILISFILFVFGLNAQTIQTNKYENYNRWTISGDFGLHLVADASSEATSKIPSFGGDIRYNINPKIGIGLSGGVDDINLFSTVSLNTPKYDLTYTRVNFETYINTFNMVDIYSETFSVLFHGGPGASFIRTNNQYKQTIPNIRGGLTLLIKVLPRVSLKGDISATANYTTDKTLDGLYDVPNAGVNSVIGNVSAGLSISLGKNKQHMDNYVPEEIVPVVNNYYKSDTTLNVYNNYASTINSYKMVDTVQYVFFKNDKYELLEDNGTLSAIFKTYVNLLDNPTYTLEIVGWASNTKDKSLLSDSDKYNLELSENRSNAVMSKLIDMGISKDRMKIKYYGKDKTLSKKSVYDTGRRVELIIHTN